MNIKNNRDPSIKLTDGFEYYFTYFVGEKIPKPALLSWVMLYNFNFSNNILWFNLIKQKSIKITPTI